MKWVFRIVFKHLYFSLIFRSSETHRQHPVITTTRNALRILLKFMVKLSLEKKSKFFKFRKFAWNCGFRLAWSLFSAWVWCSRMCVDVETKTIDVEWRTNRGENITKDDWKSSQWGLDPVWNFQDPVLHFLSVKRRINSDSWVDPTKQD